MLCQNCQRAETQVIDSRDDGKVVWRRRECLKCNFRFTTYERIEIPKLSVIKRDGSREPYVREKILQGIEKACNKRPVKQEQIEEIVDKIEKALFEKGEKEIETKQIGALVMDELKKLDLVAYIRFASVYRDFKSPKSFDKEIHKLIK